MAVIGGGTSGYFAALAVKRRFPEVSVTLVESPDVPIIGVGEATTTLMPPFLHGQLGIDAAELFAAVKPTFKLGIRFEWGAPGDYWFTYPFGDADPVEAYAFERDLRQQSFVSMLMNDDRAPVLRDESGALRSLLTQVKFAYHLDNAPFVRFLARTAAQADVAHVAMTIDRVERTADGEGIAAVHDRDGREVRSDFFVDATGFRSLLLEDTLGSPFESWASTLFCDRAIVATVPQPGPVRPYTTAETMDAGWCWRIPVEGEDHRGYVHASAFLDEDAAVDEMRARNPGMGDPWVVRFRSGRHRDFWRGNTVAVGNAYGFVEPLESTALHMVIIELAYLLAGLAAMDDPADDGTYPSFANGAVGGHWDYLRWFLGVHYKFNRRRETPFWEAARADVSGLQHVLDRFLRDGPELDADGRRYVVGDPAFGYSGLTMMLLGQHAPGPVKPRGRLDRAGWEARVAAQRSMVRTALPHGEALAALRANPAMLAELMSSPASWCHGDAERVVLPPRGREVMHPRSNLRSEAATDWLLRPVGYRGSTR